MVRLIIFQSGNMTLFVLTFRFIFHFHVLPGPDWGLILNGPSHCSLLVSYDFIIKARVTAHCAGGSGDKIEKLSLRFVIFLPN